MIPSTPEAKAAFITAFKERFKSTDKGITLKYIGVNVDQSVKGCITLSQHEYIKSILVKAGMENCYPALTPAIPKTVLCVKSCQVNFIRPTLCVVHISQLKLKIST